MAQLRPALPARRLRSSIAAALAALAGVAFVRGAPAPPGAPPDLLLFHAASLKDVFAALSRRFEADNPGVRVVANAAGSQELRAQLEHGAAADVFASADRKHMDALAAQGLVASPVVFACNEPVVVVRAGFTPPIDRFAELARAERIVLGAPEVPIGSYARQILEKAAASLGGDFSRRVEARVVSRELSVRQVLAKITLGEADAGIVYRSDARAAGDKVRVVLIPPSLNVLAEYPIASVTAAPHPELGRRWIELVRSPLGAHALRDAGFAPCGNR